jgi:tetratricopeptide (TPR) repeat protein
MSLYGDAVGGNPHGSFSATLALPLAPGFDLGFRAAYRYYSDFAPEGGLRDPLYHGLSASLSAAFTPGIVADPSRRSPRIDIGPPRFERVFPVLYRYYDTNPFGNVSVVNEERGTIEELQISFFVPQYMDSPKLLLEIDELGRGEELELPLRALFTDDILDITESTSVQAQVIASYEQEGVSLTATRTETLEVRNRNQMTWDDDRKAAAFVTAGDPTVQRLARNVTAATRDLENVAVNERLRTVMAIHETLGLFGIEYVIDPDSSYIELSADESAIDYLQFPSQTLDFRGGDCDDLSILYAALMETVGIPAAFVTVPGHIFVAFDLGITEDEARRTFANDDDLLYRNGRAWLPVETTLQGRSFLEAWAVGAQQYRENVRTDDVGFYSIRDAWSLYPPTGFASTAIELTIPEESQIAQRYEGSLSSFIAREITPQVEELQARILERPSPRLYNRLGTVYARYGLYAEARSAFEEAIRARPHSPALHNLANIHFLEENFEEARLLYLRALEVEPDDPAALLGAARASFELERYNEATALFSDAELISPEAVEPFAYIVNRSVEIGRASALADRRRVTWEED